jgi:glucokinase
MSDVGSRSGKNRILAGVDIGGTKTAVVISAEPPTILGRAEFATLADQGPERALNLIQEHLEQLLHVQGIDKTQLEAVGVSCGSPLDRISGVVQAPPNLPTWMDVPITSILQEKFDVVCRLENDANAGAVAEHRFGAGQGVQHMVFLTMGTGLGAGIIADGRLYHGASDSAGEIGHVRLTASGPIGYHKAGSVEGWASGGGIAQVGKQEVAAAIERGESTALAPLLRNGGGITAKDIAIAAQQGDELAKRIIRSTGTRLGEALAILVDILNPERIVIGGLAMRLGESLLTPARAAMEREALTPSCERCSIVPAALGEQIGDIAAICVAMGF